jgi:DNA-binding MarR family transcriptional regulator
LRAVRHPARVVGARPASSRVWPINFSLAKLAALRQLSRAGDALPLGQLAERLACGKSNVTQLVDRLEADGLVKRLPDPGNRRSRLAVLTDKGPEAGGHGDDIRDQAERELFSALSADEALVWRRLLAKLTS